MSKKWYVIETWGETERYSVVELTDAEYETIKSIFQQSYTNTIVSYDYGGQTALCNHGFNTKDEAVAYIYKCKDDLNYEPYDVILMHDWN